MFVVLSVVVFGLVAWVVDSLTLDRGPRVSSARVARARLRRVVMFRD